MQDSQGMYSLVQNVGTYCGTVYVAIYMRTVLKMPATEVGFIVLIAVTCAALFIPVFGLITDRVGPVKTLVACYVCYIVLSYPCYAIMGKGFGMTLGQEFSAYATTIGEDILRVEKNRKLLLEINLGATAIGTGINAPSDYSRIVCNHLSNLIGLNVVTSDNLIEATWDTGCYVQISGVLKRFAVKLSKICNDLRLLSSGPRTGINEINLPRRQPGSSIMPGKVNPVIPEVINQICFDVIGKDMTVTMAAEAGQLELNVMEPIIAHTLFLAVERLGIGCRTLGEKCVEGITANRERCLELVINSIGIVTNLVPVIGYEKSAAIAKEALDTNKSVSEVALAHGRRPASIPPAYRPCGCGAVYRRIPPPY